LLPRTALAFQKAISVLRDNERLRARMAKQARTRIEQDWDWAARAEGFARMFDEALAAPRGEAEARSCVAHGMAALQRNERGEAVRAFQQALDAHVDCALAHAHLASLWWDEGTHDAALTALGHQRMALQLGRNDEAVRDVLAGLLRRQGKADLAAALATAT
jgi:hypothetical protein